jgi:hypothetical protein
MEVPPGSLHVWAVPTAGDIADAATRSNCQRKEPVHKVQLVLARIHRATKIAYTRRFYRLLTSQTVEFSGFLVPLDAVCLLHGDSEMSASGTFFLDDCV